MVERLQRLYAERVEGDVAEQQPAVTLRIAMWSGPRNLSTAMMRSFGNRADTFVSDEPFYGAFLKASGAAASDARRGHRGDGLRLGERRCATLAGPAPGRRAGLVPEAYVAPYGRAGRL